MASVATSTSELYAKRIQSFRRSRPDLSLFEPAGWVAELKRRGLSLAALKSYASAIRFHARESLEDASDFVAAFDAALESLQAVTVPAPSRRRPTIHADVIDALRSAAHHRAEVSEFAHIAIDLAEGSLHFGLRPSEWASASFNGKSLSVRNGKFLRRFMDHGIFKGRLFARANGMARTMEVQSGHGVPVLSELLGRIDSFFAVRSFKKHQRAIQIEFRKVVRLAIEQGRLDRRYSRISLYSFRHQFAATAKANLSARSGSVAALMGHISARTALQSYARKVAGRVGGLAVSPSAEAVAAVENLLIYDAAVFSPDGEVLEQAGPVRRGADGVTPSPAPQDRDPREAAPNPDSSGFKPPGVR